MIELVRGGRRKHGDLAKAMSMGADMVIGVARLLGGGQPDIELLDKVHMFFSFF